MTGDERGSSGVPEGWSTKQLDEVANFASGGTPSKQEPENWNGSFPWVSAKDMKTIIIRDSELKLTPQGTAKAKIAPKDSILVLTRGMTLMKDLPVGYVVREVAFNQDIKALVPKESIFGKFLAYALIANKHSILSLVDVAGHGTGRLDTELLKEFFLEVPPLEEQRKIAEILSAWDEAIEQQTQLLELKRERKRGLMQQLLTGRVRFKEFTGLEWEMVELGSLLNYLGNGLTYDTEQTEGAKVTRIETISAGVVNTSKVGYTVQTDELERYRLQRGDILYSHINSLSHIGKVAYFDIDDALYHGMNLLLLRPNEKIVNKYLYYLLTSSQARKQALSNAKSAVNQASINTKELRKFTFSLPSLPEQQKIATVLSAADAEIETLTVQLSALKSQKRGLMQRLLTGKTRVQLT